MTNDLSGLGLPVPLPIGLHNTVCATLNAAWATTFKDTRIMSVDSIFLHQWINSQFYVTTCERPKWCINILKTKA